MRRELPPLGESRTNRYLRRHQEHRELLELSDRIARDVGLPTPEVVNIASKLPGDPISLRGIPAIGRCVGGAIHQTRPGDGLE